MSVFLTSFGATLKSGNVFNRASVWFQLITHAVLAKNDNVKASKKITGAYQLKL